MYGALDISTSGLVAQRIQLDTIAGNIANMHTTRRGDGQPGPFLRRVALMASGDGAGGAGAHVEKIVEDTKSQPRLIYDPGHVDADENGYVAYPNIDESTEMVNAMVAVRAYEANLTATSATKSIIAATLRLLG